MSDVQIEGTSSRSLDPTVPVYPLTSTSTSADDLVLSGATVGKAILSSGSTPRATGVEFRDQLGTTYTANARREVIIATGSIKTPVILQQSGIGPSSVLQAAGVQQRVDLPVGMNLIDQTTTTTSGSFRNARGGGQPIVFPRFQVSQVDRVIIGMKLIVGSL
jgi:choline dehydrogenase-like flavoprotein